MEELQDQKLRLEIQKLIAETAKATAETERINTPWYGNVDTWKSIVPSIFTTVVLLASLYFTVGRSLIDDEKRKLELQKEQLKLEVLQFGGVKEDIQKQIASAKVNKDSLDSQIIALSKKSNSLMNRISYLKNSTKTLKEKNNELLANYSSDTAFYHNELKIIYSAEKEYIKRIGAEQAKAKNIELQLASLAAENTFLRGKIQLTDIDKLNLSAQRSKAVGDELAKQARQSASHSEEIMKLEKNYSKKKSQVKTAKDLQRWFDLYFLGRNKLD